MLSSRLGHFFDKPFTFLAKKTGISPNTLTVTGFIITVIAAVMIPRDLFLGGLLIVIGALFDVFDGVVARTNNKTSTFGAFLDSVLDRYSDAVLFCGFAWYFLEKGSVTGAGISIATMTGALLISYTRARAEGLGGKCHTGLMERPERIILMALAALTGYVMEIMWLMLVLTHVTVVQRILYVRGQLK